MIAWPIIKRAITEAVQKQTIISRGDNGPTPPVGCAFPFDTSITALSPGSLPLVISGSGNQTISTPAPQDLVDGIYLAGTNVAAPIAVDWPADEMRIVERVPVSLLAFEDGSLDIQLLHGSGVISLGTGSGIAFGVVWVSHENPIYQLLPYNLNATGVTVGVNLTFEDLPEYISVGVTGDGFIYLIVNGVAYPVLESLGGVPWQMDVSAGIVLVDFMDWSTLSYTNITGKSTGQVLTDASQFQNTYPAIRGITKQEDLCGNVVREDAPSGCKVTFTAANPPEGTIGLNVNNPTERLSATVAGEELHGATFWAKSAESFAVDLEWEPSRVFQFWPTAYDTGTVVIGLVSANHSIFVQHVRSDGATFVEVDEVGVASGIDDTVHNAGGITFVVGADGTASVRVSGVEFWEASELFAGEAFWMEFYWLAPNSDSNTQWWWTSHAATGRLGLIHPGDADWCGREIPSVQIVEEARELSFTGSASMKMISTIKLLAPTVSIVEEARELSFTGSATMKIIQVEVM